MKETKGMKWIRSLKLLEKRKLCNVFVEKIKLQKLEPKFLPSELAIESDSEFDLQINQD